MIYDCFSFFNELDLLELRLNVLNDYVDYFVLVESDKTHSGKDKILYYNENKKRFNKFKNKIIYKSLSLNSDNSWKNEFDQRNYILCGLETNKLNDSDIILLSDVDEIPNPKNLNFSKIEDHKIYNLTQKLYFYYLNYYCSHIEWQGTQMFTYKTLKDSGNKLSEIRRDNNIGFKSNPCKFPKIKLYNDGWHFSYMGGINNVIEKMLSFMHQELLQSTPIDKDIIENKMINGDWIWQDGQIVKLTKVDLNYTFPDYIIKNLNKFNHLIKT